MLGVDKGAGPDPGVISARARLRRPVALFDVDGELKASNGEVTFSCRMTGPGFQTGDFTLVHDMAQPVVVRRWWLGCSIHLVNGSWSVRVTPRSLRTRQWYVRWFQRHGIAVDVGAARPSRET